MRPKSRRPEDADLRRHRCRARVHRTCAYEVCTGIVHVWPLPNPITTAGMTGIRLDAEAVKTPRPSPAQPPALRPAHRGPRHRDRPRERPGTNSGATRYHLRRLESVGLVTDTGEGEGKRRLWRASTESYQSEDGDFVGDEDAETALGWLAARLLAPLRRAATSAGSTPRPAGPWRGGGPGESDDMRDRSPPSSSRAAREIDEVVARYRRVGQGNPAARRVAVYTVRLPARPRPGAPRR